MVSGREGVRVGLLCQRALPLHAKPICADAAIHTERATKTAAGVGVLSVKLADDARLGSDHADLAKLGTGDSASAVGVDVCLISELPDVGSVPAIHFEPASVQAFGGRTPP